MRKFVAAVAVVLSAFSLASAEEFLVFAKKIEGNKITFAKLNFSKGEKDVKDEDLPLADKVACFQGVIENKSTDGKLNVTIKAGEPLEGGLDGVKALLKDAGKGLPVYLVIGEAGDNKGKVTEIRTFPKKDKDKDDKK